MLNTIRAVMKKGRLELLEEIVLPEGTEVSVTPLLNEPDMWLKASETSLDAIWDNEEDDVYTQLLSE